MKKELIRFAAGKARESFEGGKVNGKALTSLVLIGLLVIGGFIAYRLILVDLISHMVDHH